MEIILDADGFFKPTGIFHGKMRAKQRKISVVREQQSHDSLFEQYYLGLRSSMFICSDTIKNESDALETIRKFCEDCIPIAMRYTQIHITKKLVLPADFMWIAKEAILSVQKKKYPKAKDIKLQLSMKPRLSARTVEKNTIVFPALARTVINHCNLVIANSFFQSIDGDGKLIDDIDRRQIARYIFPYLLFCHDDFSVRNLPIISAYSKEAFSIAMRFTNLQIIFIFAHEYAHILLQHLDESETNLNRKEDMENEADALALQIVLDYIEISNGGYSKYDVLTAIRWLFKYQLIDASISTLIRGKSLEFSDSKIEKRRGSFQLELMNNHGLKGSTLLDAVGFGMIVELQSVLYEFGTELIGNMIDIFHKSRKNGKIEPWWEQINGEEYAPGQFKNIVDLFSKSRIQEE